MTALRHILALIFLAAGLGGAVAQSSRIDVNAIGVQVSMHPDVYHRLLDRFVGGDSLLTVGEMATVYYGYSYTPGYNPGKDYAAATEAFERKDWNLASFLASEGLAESPVSLDLTSMGLIASKHAAGESMKAKTANLGMRFNLLAALILASGNGTIPESPFKVISYNDMLSVLKNVIGVTEIVGRSRVGNIEAIKIRLDDTEREHILYFDNTRQKQFEALQDKN